MTRPSRPGHHPRISTRRSAWCAGALALALVGAGCASDSEMKPNANTTAGSASSTTAGGAGASSTTASQATTPTTPSASAVPSAGCSSPSAAAPAVHLEKRTVQVGGAERWYLITVPAPATPPKPLPLVIDFHGLVEGAEVHARMSGFAEFGERNGLVTVMPQGTGPVPSWKAGPGGSAAGANPDLDFTTAMLDQIEAAACIDTSRVYATGLSNGAFMSSLVACRMADRFAAVAPVAGTVAYEGCTPTNDVPMLTFHGTTDPILSFNGGIGDLSSFLGGKKPKTSAATTTTAPADLNGAGYPANVKAWAARNHCGTAEDTPVTKEVIHRVYSCPAGADVEFYIVIGGGHSWPGSAFSKSVANIVGYTTFDVDATALIWKFFQRFQRVQRH